MKKSSPQKRFVLTFLRHISHEGHAILYMVMQMVIYLDVLLLSNLWVNALLLYASARIMHMPLSRLRGLLSAMLGSLFSLLIFLPPFALPWLMLIRLCGAGCMALSAFRFQSFSSLMRSTVCILLVSTIFSGGIFLVSSVFRSSHIYIVNSFVYIHISLLVLLIGTTAAAAIAVLLSAKQQITNPSSYLLHLRIGGKDFCMNALADTGNTLRDAFSGKPVIICPRALLTSDVSCDLSVFSKYKGFRMLPIQTVAGQTVLPAFQPEYAAIAPVHSPALPSHPIDVLLAVTEEQTPAVIPACCLRF